MNDEIRTYLMAHRANQNIETFSDADSLLEMGVIDSMTMVDLITHLETTYKISIDEDDMMPENFDSIGAIVGYVESKTK